MDQLPSIKKVNLTPEHDPTAWQGRVLHFLMVENVLPTDMRDELIAIILAVLGNNRNHYPRYAYQAYIDKDGMVTSDFAPTRDERTWIKRKHIASVETLTGMLRTLADALKFADADRIAMFDEIRRWIARDERAIAADDMLDVPGFDAKAARGEA